MFIPADVFGSVTLFLSLSHTHKTKQKQQQKKNTSHIFHMYTFSHETVRLRGEAHCFDGEVRSTPFVLACWDQWSPSMSHKLTDGALLQGPESGRSSWFLIGHERQSATPVTAGHGHHHTSGTWGHKGDRFTGRTARGPPLQPCCIGFYNICVTASDHNSEVWMFVWCYFKKRKMGSFLPLQTASTKLFKPEKCTHVFMI